MRRVLAGASLILAAAFLTSCGDDDPSDAPDDASTEEFCDAMNEGPQGDDVSEDDLKDWAEELNDAGTPDDMSDDERDGFEVWVETLQEVNPDDFDADAGIEDVIDDEDDVAKVTAFLTYFGTTCTEFDLPTEEVPAE